MKETRARTRQKVLPESRDHRAALAHRAHPVPLDHMVKRVNVVAPATTPNT